MEVASSSLSSLEMWFVVVVFVLLFYSFAFLDLLVQVYYLLILAKLLPSRFNYFFILLLSTNFAELLKSSLQSLFVLGYSCHISELLLPLFQGLRFFHKAWHSKFLQSFLFDLNKKRLTSSHLC